jgi:hypothetical protein
MSMEEYSQDGCAGSVRLEELQIGSVYFMTGFLDKELLCPFVQPLVFIGKNIAREDGQQDRRWYFQYYESYRDGTRYPGARNVGDADGVDEPELIVFPSDGDIGVCDLEHVVQMLVECAARSVGRPRVPSRRP